MNSYIRLVASVAVCFLVAFAGSYFTFPALSGWYENLNKPFFNPPNWVFGPVWTVLYLMMGISFYIIWDGPKKKDKSLALRVFLLQLFLNFLWSFAFFGLQNPVLGFMVIALLWLSIFLTIKLFLRISRTAGYLLLPYLLWVSFASVLNLFVAFLN